MFRFEGRRGVEVLCRVAAALGYKDPMHYGQLTSKATLGDLICMLEDNSGLIETMLEWIGSVDSDEWSTNLKSLLPDDEDDEDENIDIDLDGGLSAINE